MPHRRAERIPGAATGGEGQVLPALLLVLAVLGWLLRALPLLAAGDALRYPVDYDEGVYFSAAALLARGVIPYRDFVFVHPPGLLLVLSPAAWLSGVLGPSFAFALARHGAALVGA